MAKFNVYIAEMSTVVVEADNWEDAYDIAERDLVGDNPDVEIQSITWKSH
jgi:hypothetical protein